MRFMGIVVDEPMLERINEEAPTVLEVKNSFLI